MRWAAASSAASATPLIERAAAITSGGFNPLPDTAGAWVALTGFELTLPAAAGDRVEIAADFLRDSTGGSFLDLAVRVGTGLVRFAATGGSSAPLEGNPGWYPVVGFSPVSGPFSFTVTSGDIDGGNVRFVLACKGNGTGRLFADTNYPFRWRALNKRVVA